MRKIKDADFSREVLESDLPVLVEFSATWCQPCKALEPILDEASAHFGDKIKILKADVEDAPEATQRFMVQSVPTMLFFKGGKVLKQMVGLAPKKKIYKAIEAML